MYNRNLFQKIHIFSFSANNIIKFERTDFMGENFNSGKVLLMNNAIDLNKFSYNEEIRNKVRQKYGIRGKFCVGHVGRFMNQKNHNYLIDIFEEIKRKNSNSILLLIGTGELLDDIKEKISLRMCLN